MGFSRQEHWSGLPFPSPGGLPDPGMWGLYRRATRKPSVKEVHPQLPQQAIKVLLSSTTDVYETGFFETPQPE